MALYLAKNRQQTTPIVPVPNGTPVIGALMAGELCTVLHVSADSKSSLVKTSTKAGWVASSSLTKQPFLMVDLYRKELGGKPPMTQIVDTPFLSGVLLKCTQGLSYDTAWFLKYWPMIGQLAGDRHGVSFFRGAYQYLVFAQDGKKQALYYAKTLKAAGGWDPDLDIRPIVDVENGSDPKQAAASAQQVIDVTTAYAEAIEDELGVRPMLYGGSAIRGRKITSHMGCAKLWCARYTAKLPSKTYTQMGWALPDVWGWQYGGTGPDQRASLAGYPKEIPGVGQLDISVVFANTFADVTA